MITIKWNKHIHGDKYTWNIYTVAINLCDSNAEACMGDQLK